MDYERKYKELAGKIKKAYLYAQTDSTKAVLKNLLPELKESKDEQIRKELFDFLTYGIWQSPVIDKVKQSQRYVVWLSWLEKQSNLMKALQTSNTYCQENCKGYQETGRCVVDGECEAKKSQRMISAEAKEALYDKPTWSEEDEEMLDGIILRCEKYGYQEQINWLKSLIERYTWKPSYEQLEALWCAAEKELESDDPNVVELRGKVLESLYNDLNKLKGE